MNDLTHYPTWGKVPNLEYPEFLRRKASVAKQSGFEVSDDDINPILKPHQRDIVKWAVKGGRRAIFAKFGLGKSVIQLEILRLISERDGGRAFGAGRSCANAASRVAYLEWQWWRIE